MQAGAQIVLATCSGGGNNFLAFLVVLVVFTVYALSIGAALTRAEDGNELAILLLLLMASIAIGAFVFLYPNGTSGNGDYLSRFIISLLVSGVIAVLAAAKWAEQAVGRAVFVALAGDVLIPGGLIVLLFASVGIGTGCLD